MRILLSLLLWLPVIIIKIVLVFLGIVIVPVGFFSHNLPKIYRGTLGRPNTIWELMVRNPVDGFKRIFKHPLKPYKEYGIVVEPHTTDVRFQWRFRIYKLFSSLRFVWKYNDEKYGEMYIGWKLGSAPPDLDFALSLRPYAKVGN